MLMIKKSKQEYCLFYKAEVVSWHVTFSESLFFANELSKQVLIMFAYFFGSIQSFCSLSAVLFASISLLFVLP